MLELDLSVLKMYNVQVSHGEKCNDDYNNHHHHWHNGADDNNNIIDCNFYSSKCTLHYLELRHGKNHEDTKMCALLHTKLNVSH